MKMNLYFVKFFDIIFGKLFLKMPKRKILPKLKLAKEIVKNILKKGKKISANLKQKNGGRY